MQARPRSRLPGGFCHIMHLVGGISDLSSTKLPHEFLPDKHYLSGLKESELLSDVAI